jgi:AraC-like DNA-binding protein
VHPDVYEPLTVELHGSRPARPFKQGRPPLSWQPQNYRRIMLEGFGLTYMYGKSFELAFETSGHLIDFNFGDGPSVMQVNGSKQEIWRFGPHMTSFAPCGTELYRHALDQNDEAACTRLIALSVSPDYLNGLVSDILDGREVAFVEMSRPERWPKMDRIQSAFLALFEMPNRYSALTAEALANDAIMRALMRWSSVGNRIVPTRFRTDDEAVSRAVEFIRANLRQRLSLADIARAAQRDATILVHVFKLVTGRTPYAYLLESRIDAAKQDLRMTSLPIAQISQNYCFGSPSHFSTTFRKLAGMTPKAYREMAKS